MSIQRLGLNPDGTRRTVDEGPSSAHMLTRGGELLGSGKPLPPKKDYGHPGRARRRAARQHEGAER